MKPKVVLVLLLATVACEEPSQTPEDVEKYRKNEPTQELFGITYYYSDSAMLKAKLIAPHILEKKEKQETVIYINKGLHLEFFTETGQKESELSANRAILYNQRNYAEVYENVRVSNINGDRLETEKLIWDKQKDKIYTDAFVKITTSKEILLGTGMESNTSFTNYKIFKLKGTIRLQE
ncbi:MAG: LPS export ABC transporter periplasmic protein LptC [Bacteroidia bacterium]|nr:LPS export ABC transporter periplasmic protein LptC [Bacteroidia bacterium]